MGRLSHCSHVLFDFKQSRETFNCDPMQSGVEGDVHIPFYCRRNVRFCCIFSWTIHQLLLCRHRRAWTNICKSWRNFAFLMTLCADEMSVWIHFYDTTLRLWVIRSRLLEAVNVLIFKGRSVLVLSTPLNKRVLPCHWGQDNSVVIATHCGLGYPGIDSR